MTKISELHRGHYIQTRILTGRLTDVADDISFTAPDLINSAATYDFTTLFQLGQSIVVVTGSGTNDGTYVIATLGASQIELVEQTITTETGATAGQVDIDPNNSRDFTGVLDTDLDFSLNYREQAAREWSYDDSTKIFEYLGDHAIIHRFNWSISVERTDGTTGNPLMAISVKTEPSGGGGYTILPISYSYRNFSGLDAGFFGADFLHLVNVGDKFKMSVHVVGPTAPTVLVRNLLFSAHVNDVIS